MQYYRAYITCGNSRLKRDHNRTIFVQTASKTPASDVLSIIRKIPFGRMITVQKIEREAYITGVSRTRG